MRNKVSPTRLNPNLISTSYSYLQPVLESIKNYMESSEESVPIQQCRCCGSDLVQSCGKLPDASVFAGSHMNRPLPGGNLYTCHECNFVFRAPIFSKQTYDELYKAGISDVWDDEQRADHDLVREAIQKHLSGGSVLDVGCSAGSLLAPLVGHYATFGAEINRQAAKTAEGRGIHILAHDIDDVANLPHRFNAIVACDVIEHVVNPRAFINMLLSKTSENGLVIISTGNASAWSWSLFGSRFWYCFLPEHISFVSPEWFLHLTNTTGADQVNADIIETKRFVYSPAFPWHGKAIRLALMALFHLSPKLYFGLLPARKRHYIPVGRGITRDHFVIVLQKRSAT